MKREIFFSKNHAKNEAGRLVPGLSLFLNKALHELKASGPQLSFNIFRQSSTLHTIKTNYIKLQTIDPDMFSFEFSEKGLGIGSTPHIVYDF